MKPDPRKVPDRLDDLVERYKKNKRRGMSVGRRAVWLRYIIIKHVLLCDEEVNDEGHCACSRLIQDLLVEVIELESGHHDDMEVVMQEKEQSPALALVRHVFKRSRHKSWRRFNPALYEALRLAITANLEFNEGDVAEIYNKLKGGFWFSENREALFAAAVKSGNISACKSWEAWQERPPFILEGERLYVGSCVNSHHLGTEPRPGTVTSFNSDDKSIIVCIYKKDDKGAVTSAVERRIRLTIEEVRALAKAERDRKKGRSS